ncbi:MAG: RpiB/LacA/LacB family sugar-phosphate isomerase [Legionellaceae bacterium]
MMVKKIFIASDHAGFQLKQKVISWCLLEKNEVLDLGTDSAETSCHYSEFALVTVKKLLSEFKLSGREDDACAILICGSGIGMSMAANRFSKIRAALCKSVEEAKLARQHNNANILCLGARSLSDTTNLDIVKKFLSTEFEGSRHQTRIDFFNLLGEK